jgi:hypothetical protein
MIFSRSNMLSSAHLSWVYLATFSEKIGPIDNIVAIANRDLRRLPLSALCHRRQHAKADFSHLTFMLRLVLRIILNPPNYMSLL